MTPWTPDLAKHKGPRYRAIADARIVIENGADYDPWMEKLLGANRSASRTVR